MGKNKIAVYSKIKWLITWKLHYATHSNKRHLNLWIHKSHVCRFITTNKKSKQLLHTFLTDATSVSHIKQIIYSYKHLLFKSASCIAPLKYVQNIRFSLLLWPNKTSLDTIKKKRVVGYTQKHTHTTKHFQLLGKEISLVRSKLKRQNMCEKVFWRKCEFYQTNNCIFCVHKTQYNIKKNLCHYLSDSINS